MTTRKLAWVALLAAPDPIWLDIIDQRGHLLG